MVCVRACVCVCVCVCVRARAVCGMDYIVLLNLNILQCLTYERIDMPWAIEKQWEIQGWNLKDDAIRCIARMEKFCM